jgi:hypothetical protein
MKIRNFNRKLQPKNATEIRRQKIGRKTISKMCDGKTIQPQFVMEKPPTNRNGKTINKP